MIFDIALTRSFIETIIKALTRQSFFKNKEKKSSCVILIKILQLFYMAH